MSWLPTTIRSWATSSRATRSNSSLCPAPAILAASRCGGPRGGKRQMVGPFIFFDHFGPVQFVAGQGLDVRPHPHIGLATVTYLLGGRILPRDSEGHIQEIRPGAMNLMTAGRGIAHSERTPEPVRAAAHEML